MLRLESFSETAESSDKGRARRLALQAISFANFRFYGFGCGKLPISVWFGARGTRMQFARFPACCTASATEHG
jgi:hypothetical protein